LAGDTPGSPHLHDSTRPHEEKETTMATGETGFGDVMFDLISIQYHSLKAGHDYGQYVRDARNGGYEDVATFVEQVMEEDAKRAAECHRLLKELDAKEDTGGATE
jgi:hypothetical protein